MVRLKLLSLFASLGMLLACPAGPGQSCRPGHDRDCAGDYYCSYAKICTLDCDSTSDCNYPCSAEANPGDACGSCEGDVCPTCDADLLCQPAPATCIEGYCQQPCAETDSCGYDPYGPRPEDQ